MINANHRLEKEENPVSTDCQKDLKNVFVACEKFHKRVAPGIGGRNIIK